MRCRFVLGRHVRSCSARNAGRSSHSNGKPRERIQSATARPWRASRAQLRGLVAAVLGELFGELHGAARDHVVAEHHLVLALEDVVADEVGLDHVEVELLLHLARDRFHRDPRRPRGSR
jgi:hypothetical protein